MLNEFERTHSKEPRKTSKTGYVLAQELWTWFQKEGPYMRYGRSSTLYALQYFWFLPYTGCVIIRDKSKTFVFMFLPFKYQFCDVSTSLSGLRRQIWAFSRAEHENTRERSTNNLDTCTGNQNKNISVRKWQYIKVYCPQICGLPALCGLCQCTAYSLRCGGASSHFSTANCESQKPWLGCLHHMAFRALTEGLLCLQRKYKYHIF